MFENFQVDEPLFEGQIHELNKFKLIINGEEYQGLLTDGEINWFHPKPHTAVEEEHLEAVEDKIQSIMKDYLQ